MKNNKLILSLLLLFFVIQSAFAQSDYQVLLRYADSLVVTGKTENLSKAFTIYSRLQDKVLFPEADLQYISNQKVKISQALDRLLKDLEATNRRIEQQLWDLGKAALDAAFEKEQQQYLKKNPEKSPDYFDESDVKHLDLSNYGLVWLPLEIAYYENLESIDLRGNPYLDTAQVFRLLSYISNLKQDSIKIDTIRSFVFDTLNKRIKQKFLAEIKSLSYRDFGDKDLNSLLQSAYQQLKQGKFSTAFNYYAAAAMMFNGKTSEILKIEKLAFKYLSIIIAETNSKTQQFEKIRCQTEIALLNRALTKIFVPDSIKIKKLDEPKLFTIDSLDFSGMGLTWLPLQALQQCRNLEFINLIGNPVENWDSTLAVLTDTTLFPKLKHIWITTYNLSEISPKYWDRITGIDLDTSGIDSIPANILAQKQLEYLDLSGKWNNKNIFNPLPKELFELKNLKHLYLNYCLFDSLPGDIRDLINLQSLVISRNDSLWRLPLPQLPNLQSLEISYNDNLKKLAIPKIRNLQSLVIYGNDNLASFTLPEFPNLQSLEISYNDNLKKLVIPKIRNLQSLEISGNDNLTSFTLPELPNLRSLIIYYNYNLSNLILPELPNLQSLEISENYRLSAIELPQLPNLQSLEICYNNLDTIFDLSSFLSLKHLVISVNILGLEKLLNLQYLEISGNDSLKNLTLPKLPNLQFLETSGIDNLNSLTLPQLPNLQSLEICCNDNLTAIELPQLPNLQSLKIFWNNNLTDIQLPELPNLHSLEISENYRLTGIELPQLPNLQSLEISENWRLTSLNLSELPNLQSLGISYNDALDSLTLPELPNLQSLGICCNDNLADIQLPDLLNLQSLKISGNDNLTDLPFNVASFPKLAYIKLTGNPLDKDKFTKFLRACTKPVKLTTNYWIYYNYDPSFLLIVVDRIEEEWGELENVSEY